MKKFAILLIFFSASGWLIPAWHIHAQTGDQPAGSTPIAAKVTGTGRTTGHIITLTISNSAAAPLTLEETLVYIPSDGKYQPYIARIPRTVIPPGTTTIPVHGFCTDIHKPPVPDGGPMPDLTNWIPVGDPDAPVPEGTVQLFPRDPVPPFEPTDIPAIVNTPQYKPFPPEFIPDFVPTWPGTDLPVGGTLDPTEAPEVYAPVIAEVFIHVETAAEKIISSGDYPTPFTPVPEKEQETFIQQVIWIYAGLISDQEYGKQDFVNITYLQFRDNTGQPVTALPEKEKEKLDGGVDAFWSAFAAVGVEAKVLSMPVKATTAVTEEKDPAPEETIEIDHDEGGCNGQYSLRIHPPFDMDMKIAEQWGDAEERSRIEADTRKALEESSRVTAEETFRSYDINRHPTSATSFWSAGHIGGFASASAKTWYKRPDGRWEWVWGTEELNTRADGTMDYTLAYTHDEDCRAMVTGTALIRVRASSSAFDAMAGNSHLDNNTAQLNFLRGTKYAGKIAMEWLILRARGRTDKSFGNFVKDDLKDQIEGEITEAVQEEVQEWADQYLEGILGQMGLTMEDIMNVNFEMPSLEGLLEDVFGIDIPSLDDLTSFISEGLEATFNLFFVANTYATANGALIVRIGDQSGSALAHTSVHYARQSTEETQEAIKWTGEQCREAMISDVKPDALTIHTEGFSHMVAEAASSFGFGNGKAEAFLESMNLQILAGICICPPKRRGIDPFTYTVDVEGHAEWYTANEGMQDHIVDATKLVVDQIRDQLNDEVDAMSEEQIRNLSPDAFKNMLHSKVRAWADQHKFSWSACTREN